MFINTTNAFNVGLECPTHSADIFEFKYLPSSPLEDFLPVLLESSSIMFLYFSGLLLCTGVFCTVSIPILQPFEGKDEL